MSSVPPDGAASNVPDADDTAAFQRYYLEGAPDAPAHGLLYRLLIGWWRDR